MSELPEFVAPMLATLGDPFDSDDYLFELKWDGIRGVSFVAGGKHRILTRSGRDVTAHYPDLEALRGLPDGTVLDGELVVLRDGRPDFPSVMKREQARGERRVAELTHSHPASYVVFDLLYRKGRSLLDRPFSERRLALTELLAERADPRVALSDGIVGAGRSFFDQARKRSLEGVVAKRLASPYQPGKRTRDWMKFKLRRELACVVLGYVRDDEGGLKSLVIAAEQSGELAAVGRVGSGLSSAQRTELFERMRGLHRAAPIVPCDDDAQWIEPELLCLVGYLERTDAGNLRAPVFLRMLDTPDGPKASDERLS